MSVGVMTKSRVIVDYVSLMILAVTGIIPTVFADCDVDGMRCCATEFFPLVSVESGFSLDEASLNKSCHVVDPTFQCLSDYEEQCVGVTENYDNEISELKNYLTDLCSPGSKLSNDIEERRQCIMATSEKLKACALKKNYRSDNPWSKPCCEYSMLKACARSTIKENCGDEVEVLVRDLVEKINGLGYERVCKDYYDTCGSATFAATFMVVIFAAGVPFANVF